MSTTDQLDAFEQHQCRFVVGIDLGTTNCAVAYIDTQKSSPRIELFDVEQWVDFGLREPRELLPSFHYQPTQSELASLEISGTADSSVVGILARDRGLQLPGRQVASAKSWLCHAGVDRQSKILPWQADEGVEKLSPVEASSKYLSRIRAAWNTRWKNQPLEDQDIVITLPASFDQVARQLTIEAAKLAGLPRIMPIEEPQAAFYAWLARHAQDWESRVASGQTVLVCDIGGGTTDFTLIRVRSTHQADSEEAINALNQSKMTLHRVAVGQHLILGGDNIDLALAKLAETKLGKPLTPRAWDALRQSCRVAKETLLANATQDSFTIHLPGSGSRLIGGGSQVELTSQDVEQCVVDGFFPKCNLLDGPQAEQTGFQEFGLPYAQDAAITRHLSAFLWKHRRDGRTEAELEQMVDVEQARPDAILFNGGVMTSGRLVDRTLEVVGSWFAGTNGLPKDWRPKMLDGERLDLAVAKGAAYFGQVKRGIGVEIEANLACSFYLQTSELSKDQSMQAVCIVPGAASPGDVFRLTDVSFDLQLGEPVQFPIVYSNTRLADKVGQQVTLENDEIASLPPIRTVLDLSGRKRRETVPVSLEVELSQIGTLNMWCIAEDHRWKLEFDVRGSAQTDHESKSLTGAAAGILDEHVQQAARQVLEDVFSQHSSLKPAKLMHLLSEATQLKRGDWPPSLLRSLWQSLLELSDGRKQSAAHEARWLNLLGYCLRPGYGMAADDWRVAETWRSVHGKLAYATPEVRNEAFILWRRIAGGFTAGQQLAVYQQIAGPVRNVLDPQRRSKGGGGIAPNDLIELLRLVGSLELLPITEKSQLGDWLIQLLPAKKWTAVRDAMLWTIGRLGARVPVYGPLNQVVDMSVASRWLRALLSQAYDESSYALALMLVARRCNDRYRDIDDEMRSEVLG